VPDPKEPAEVLPGPPKSRRRQSSHDAPTNGWAAGQSGNPGGRPKGYQEFRELCRAKTQKAIETLEACLDDKDPKVRVAAAVALLDRGWGRPATTLEVGITPESALAKLAAALADDDNTEES